MKFVPGLIFAIKKLAGYAFLAGLTAVFVLTTGCASGLGTNPRDPWEGYNRPMTQFNEAVDAAVLKPAATVYKTVTPGFVRTGISNFFSNMNEPWTALNAALQLRGQAVIDTIMRFSVNTFFGFGGVLDIASEIGIERKNLDFGQTLGRWGIPTGPYLVLPIFGPSTLRDATAFSIETRADPLNNQSSPTVKDSLYILRALELRANLLRADNVLEEAALDKYTFLRDIFLQRRDNLVMDGRELPPDPEEEVQAEPDKEPAKEPALEPAKK